MSKYKKKYNQFFPDVPKVTHILPLNPRKYNRGVFYTLYCLNTYSRVSNNQILRSSPLSRKSNPEHEKALRKQKRKERLALALSISGERCAHCGTASHLEFHHRVTQLKKFNIKSILMGSMNRLIIEAKKCMTLCRSCHLEVHREIRNRDKE